jgi:hypothetical protein
MNRKQKARSGLKKWRMKMATEKRLIDANALMDAVDVSLHDNPHTDGLVRATHKHEHNHFMVMIMQAPTVDAVEVIRCCKCVYWEQLRAGTIGRCNKTIAFTNCAHFCSYGERRTG